MGCSRFHNRGPQACQNDGVVLAPHLESVLFDAVKREVLSPAAVEMVCGEIDRGLRESADAKAPTAKLEALQRRITRLDSEFKRLVDALAAGADLLSVREGLAMRQRQLARAQEQLAFVSRPTGAAVVAALDSPGDSSPPD